MITDDLNDLIAERQITPPYDWEGWADTLDDVRALPETVTDAGDMLTSDGLGQ